MNGRFMAVLIGLLMVLGACGSGDAGAEGVASLDGQSSDVVAAGDEAGQPAEEAETETEITQEEALLAFAQCMRENGADMEDPTVDADGNLVFGRFGGQEPGQVSDEDREARGAAREACSAELEGAALGFREVDQTALQDNLLAFAQCMRDNGYEEMEDPDFTAFGAGGEGGGGPFGDIDASDPEFNAAQDACSDIIAGFGPGGGRGLGGGPPGDNG